MIHLIIHREMDEVFHVIDNFLKISEDWYSFNFKNAGDIEKIKKEWKYYLSKKILEIKETRAKKPNYKYKTGYTIAFNGGIYYELRDEYKEMIAEFIDNELSKMRGIVFFFKKPNSNVKFYYSTAIIHPVSIVDNVFVHLSYDDMRVMNNLYVTLKKEMILNSDEYRANVSAFRGLLSINDDDGFILTPTFESKVKKHNTRR